MASKNGTWLRDVFDGESWRESPVQTAAQAAACSVAFPLCLGYELAARAGESVGEARGNLAGTLAALSDGVSRPIEETANVMKWAAVAIIAVAFAFVAWLLWRTIG